MLTKEFDGAVIDDPKQHQRVTSFFQRTAPELVEFVELYEDPEPLLEREGVEDAFTQVLSRRADLPSGGYMMIDYAEALTVIDVNTGSFTGRGRGRLEDTITKVNVEAADEVVRQLRLRDIGGIIVIDFIDMAKAQEPRPGAEDASQGARRRQDEELRDGGLAARSGRDDAPERHRRGARDPHPHLPDLRWRGRGAVGGDDGDRR